MAEIDIKKQIENYTKLNKRLAQYSTEIQRIFQMLNTEGCQLALSTTPALKNLDKIFRFADYPQTKAGVEKLLKKYTKELQTLIISGMEAEYTKGDETQTILGENIVNRCNSALPEDKQIPLDKAKLGIVTSSTDLAVKSFTEKRLKNFNLRSVLALQSVKYKDELECAISTALTKGTSARELAKQVTTLFRDHAKFEAQYLEKFGKKLNTGKTLYEAMRLARTEINMAYRDAEQSRWGDMPFILGYEIKLSNNHNCKGIPKGKFYDICDELEGKYPKDFKWLGWHPNCRCHAIPILMSDEQFIQWNNGKQVNATTIDKMPEKFDKWLEQNKERAKGWTSAPYFIKDNPKYIKGFDINTYNEFERKFTRATKTKEAMQEAIWYLHKKYPDIPNTELAAVYHYTKGEGATYRKLNNQLRKGNLSPFNIAFSELLSTALSKLDSTQEIVYRTLRLNKTNLKKFIDVANNNSSLTFEGFTSASLEKDIVLEFASRHTGKKKNETDVILVIQSKNGRPIEKLSQFSGRFADKVNQREVLFDKNTEFKFNRYEFTDDTYTFYISEF